MSFYPESYDALIVDDRFIDWVQNEMPESDHYWGDWKNQHPHLRDELARAIGFVQLMHFKNIATSETQLDAMFDNIHNKIEGKPPLEQKSYYRVAATISIALLCGWFIYSLSGISALKVQKVSTRKGQKTSMILADGSKVWLNGGSELIVSRNFNSSSTRTVSLEGEAYFEVAHNAKRPFIVETNDLDIKVLGTSFNVKSYKDDLSTETALLEGSIELQSNYNDQKVLIKPNQLAVAQKSNTGIEVLEVDAGVYSSWRSGILVFENEKFENVAKTLERWYGSEITIENGGECELSAKFQGESLQEILSLLKLTSSINYSVKDNEVTLNIDCKTD